VTVVRELLWSTFLPWVRIPGTPIYRSVGTPADLPGYRPYDGGHELPGVTVDDTRARKVCAWLLAAEPERVEVVTALLDRLGLAHGPDEEAWRAVGAWFAGRAPDDATPSLALDLGLLLGRRVIDARDGARWEPDADSVQAYPQVVLGVTVIALPLQAVEGHADLGDVLTTALEATEPDPAAEFTAWLDQVLDERDEPLTDDELEWMLAESGLDELPDEARVRLDARTDPSSESA
jgi:phage tail protein X